MQARLGFWAALLVAGFGAGMWLMWGQVSDARDRAATANAQALELGSRLEGYAKTLEDMQTRQQLTDASLATRAEQDNEMQSQLFRLRADLREVIESDPVSQAWGSVPVPDAVANRLWGAPSAAAVGAGNRAGAATGKPNPEPARTGTGKPN